MKLSKYAKKQLKKRICNKKVQYNTKNQAVRASVYFFTKFGNYGSPYECKYCRYFHLTSKYPTQATNKFIDELAEWFGLPKSQMYKIVYEK